MHLHAQPQRPRWLPTVMVKNMDAASIPDEWRSYWSGALET